MCPYSRHFKHLGTILFSRALAKTQPTRTLPGLTIFALAIALGARTSSTWVPFGPFLGDFTSIYVGLTSPNAARTASCTSAFVVPSFNSLSSIVTVSNSGLTRSWSPTALRMALLTSSEFAPFYSSISKSPFMVSHTCPTFDPTSSALAFCFTTLSSSA